MTSTAAKLTIYILAIFISSTTATLPYNPAAILSSAGFEDIVYLLRSTTGDSNVELVTIDVSDSLTADLVSVPSHSELVPFKVDDETAFTPFIDSRGNISVLTGQCGSAAGGAKLWTYTPNKDGLSGDWKENDLVSGENGVPQGVQFLSSGMKFSTTTDGSSILYLFGGMCPNKTGLSIDSWQSSSTYSNGMRTIRQAENLGDYTLSPLWTRGPPVAEAGFSLTPLKPTFFNSTGDGTQQQNYVLLGGQTVTAFINMSQVALFSLPQQSWTFIPVETPSTSTKPDLTKRVTSVDPRSGHTAVLTEDGTKMVVVGGWVGDVTTPAHPQLAILEIGEGFGGEGSWQWKIPEQKGTGISEGAGLYGHGATMLPGDIIMITGGFSISTSSDNDLVRRADPVASKDTLFFNVTSSTWLKSYENVVPKTASKSPSEGAGQSSESKVGLGAGLGVGLAAVLLAIILYILYRRRVKHRKIAREKELRELSMGAHRFHSQTLGEGGIDGRGGSQVAAQWMSETNGSSDAYPWAPALINTASAGSMRGTEAERTGLLVEIPSPTRGLRRSLHSRGNHWYEDGRTRSRGSGHIHRIDERDEEETEGSEGKEMTQVARNDIVTSAPILDPFRDPSERHILDGSRTPSPVSPAYEREREVEGWMNDWTAAMHRQQQHNNQQETGRLSPEKSEKSDRTSSTLSDLSVHSAVSALSFQNSIHSLSRSVSQRSSAILNSSFLSARSHIQQPAPDAAPVEASPPSPSRYRRSTALHPGVQQNRHSAGAALGTSFTKLQSEAHSLLGGPSSPVALNEPPSPAQPQSRTRSLLGSFRRALVGSASSPITSTLDRSSSSSPTKPHHGNNTLPQRSASAGAALWRRRQGAKDWDVEGRPTHDETSSLNASEEGEWDVESAVERRVVQVMFTVPRERLRVVNAGPEGDGESILSVKEAKGREGEEEAAEAGKEVIEKEEVVRRDDDPKGKGKGKDEGGTS